VSTVFRPVAVPSPAPGRTAAGGGWFADVGAAMACAIEVGVLLQLVGSLVISRGTRVFVGSSLIAEVDRGIRYRLLEVFGQASFELAVIVVVAILLTVTVPTERRSVLRRPALAAAAGLGLYIAAGATVRAVALMTFLGTSTALAAGTTLRSLAAVPVGCGALAWAATLLARDERDRKAAASTPAG
jgi:hypothetical protein